MQIYLAWSGTRSGAVGKAFAEWLPRVLHFLQPFFSPKDIEKGARWQNELENKLAQCQYGFLFLTPENVASTWLHFEAGAISRNPNSRVICFRFDGVELRQPLSQFQNVEFEEQAVWEVVKQLKDAVASAPATEIIQESFHTAWPLLKASVEAALAATEESPVADTAATEKEMLQETMDMVRSISLSIAQLQAVTEGRQGGGWLPIHVGAFGQALRRNRMRKPMSIEELAAAADVPTDTLKAIEAGKINPTVKQIGDVAKAIGVPGNFLLGYDPGIGNAYSLPAEDQEQMHFAKPIEKPTHPA